MKKHQFYAAVLIVAGAAGGAAALSPDEVVVVSNSENSDSVALGKYYARVRGIPEQNIVQIKTTQGYHVSQVDFEKQIRLPLRKALLERELTTKIRCLALMYGVPVRIARATAPDQAQLVGFYRTAAKRAHYRLAINYQMVGIVGRKFPPARNSGLKPIGMLFPPSMPEPPTPLDKLEELNKNISTLLSLKQKRLADIKDTTKRRIASRQLMALHLEIYGLNGLITYISANSPKDPPDIDDLRKLLRTAERQLNEINKQPPTVENLRTKLKLMETIDGVSLLCSHTQQKVTDIQPPHSEAAVDNELALLWWRNYPLTRHLINPLHWRYPQHSRRRVAPVLMTARIDGPSKADAVRIIKGSLAAEKTSLEGIFYIDAGGGGKVKAAAYDAHLKNLYSFLKENAKLKVVLDEEPAVFAKDACPEAALYVGWYKLRQYVPAFTWKCGAVGWHIASFEAEELRDPNSTRWCVKMIQNGVVATVGAVAEPTLGAFPRPDEFFPLLLTGKWTVAECYWRTMPMVSWRLTLIADPLYNPFAANPQVSADTLPAGLAP